MNPQDREFDRAMVALAIAAGALLALWALL